MLPTTTRFDRTGKLQRAEVGSAAHTVTLGRSATHRDSRVFSSDCYYVLFRSCLNGSHANGNNAYQLLRKELGASPSNKKKEENTMGLLKELIELKKRRGLTIDTVEVDDEDGVTAEIWLLFFPRSRPFASITVEEITDAIREAYPNVDVSALLKELEPKAKYTKNSQADFSELFKNILSKIGTYTVTRVPKPLNKIKPGSGIKGASDDSGSIGGFLINHKREIFRYSIEEANRREAAATAKAFS